MRSEHNSGAPLRGRVSVVIPVLNEAARIGDRLLELTAQGFDEVLIVDGGSHDETERVVANAQVKPRNTRWLAAPGGRGPQLNCGAHAASFDTLLFAHADTALPPGAKQLILDALNEAQVVAGAFRTWHVNDAGPSVGRARRWCLHLADVRSRYTQLPYGDQTLFLSRGVFEKVGGYPAQPLMEDLELSKRLSKLGTIRVLNQSVQVSGRRFLRHPLKTLIIHNTFPLLYSMGISAPALARLYGQVR